jgi:hypothetical protein
MQSRRVAAPRSHTLENTTMSVWPTRIAREQRVIRTLLMSLSVVLLAAACDDDDYDDFNPTEPPPPAATLVTASGAITAKVDEFRSRRVPAR